jgi:hypothetical protein
MSLELRKIKQDDLEMIMKWRMDPDVTKYMYTDPKLSIEKQREWYDKVSGSTSEKYWLIAIDDTAIGVLNLTEIDERNKRCSWAYYIGDTSFRGRGIARILECNIYDYVFEFLGLNKLCCEVFTFNEKVISIHEKFGSEIEGTLKQHIFKNGQFYDIVSMAITKDKWNKIKSDYEYEKILIEE